jgi:hypothetical protein
MSDNYNNILTETVSLINSIRRTLNMRNNMRMRNNIVLESFETDISEELNRQNRFNFEAYINHQELHRNRPNELFEEYLTQQERNRQRNIDNDLNQRTEIDIEALNNEINININLSNNIIDVVTDFIVNVGDYLLNDGLNYEEYVNLPNEKITLNLEEFNDKIEEIQEEIECGICKDVSNKDVVRLKSCNHKFCKECIKEWLTKYNIKCPMCRTDIRNN